MKNELADVNDHFRSNLLDFLPFMQLHELLCLYMLYFRKKFLFCSHQQAGECDCMENLQQGLPGYQHCHPGISAPGLAGRA